jgi:hypothetical protein
MAGPAWATYDLGFCGRVCFRVFGYYCDKQLVYIAALNSDGLGRRSFENTYYCL